MNNDFQKETAKTMSALENWLAPIFEKAPHIPANGRESIVKVAPWLALIFGILGLWMLVTAGFFASLFSFTLIGLGMYQVGMYIGLIAGIIAAVLELMAYGPLSRREKKGWNYLFYGIVITLAASILEALLGYGSGLIGSLIGALIGLWLMFEVRSLYR